MIREGRSPVSRRRMQIYILTYYTRRKREPLTALGSHLEGGGGEGGGSVISASAVPYVLNKKNEKIAPTSTKRRTTER